MNILNQLSQIYLEEFSLSNQSFNCFYSSVPIETKADSLVHIFTRQLKQNMIIFTQSLNHIWNKVNFSKAGLRTRFSFS